MGKKIRTFQDYDAAKTKREQQFDTTVQSELELLLAKEFQKSLGNIRILPVMLHPLRLMEALAQGFEGIYQLYVEQRRPVLLPKIESQRVLKSFQENIHDLLCAGIYHAREEESGVLSRAKKESFYVRVVDVVKELTEQRPYECLKQEYPEVQTIIRSFYLPEREEDIQRLRTVTEVLRREKYVSRDQAEAIVQLLFPPEKVSAFSIQTPSARLKTPAPVPLLAEHKFTASTPEESLEYLTVVLRLPRETAQSYANQVTLQQLNELHQGMNDAVGDEYTFKIIQANPDVIMYPSENLLTKYLTTLQVVQRRIKSNGDTEKLEQEFGLENNVQKYADLEQLLELKRQLFQETGKYQPTLPLEIPAEDFQVYVSRYALLKRNHAMEPRLDSLIRTGEFIVGENEHWGGEGTTTGARGRNILKIVKTELNRLFEDLGYDSPECEINFGQHTLRVPEKTQQLLGEMRDKAYSLQKK